MNLADTVAQIKSQLEKISIAEQVNQQEQSQINQKIKQLEAEIQTQYQRQSELDEKAIRLYSEAEKLRFKLSKLERIILLSQEFQELHQECQDNEDLLNTLYSSVNTNFSNHGELQSSLDLNREQPNNINNQSDTDLQLSIDNIKEALPNAEKIYQHLVAQHLEQYQVYQNFIVDGLDLIWYAVAFIAFGRSSYRQMSFKYHPDLDGSEREMQLINTAWEISQAYLGSSENVIS